MLCKNFLLIFISSCQICFSASEDISHVLYNLTNFAISARQYAPYPIRGVDYRPPYPTYPQQNYGSVMNVLSTIVRNDALRCVPRLICEATSGSISNDFTPSLPQLPFQVDMSSVLKLFGTLDLATNSPIPILGKAALLGIFSKGNSDSCVDAYPLCPQDPDHLVRYLNNYNGGFFRYFNGFNRLKSNLNSLSPIQAEDRILNKNSLRDEDFKIRETGPSLRFPESEYSNPFDFRKPKELPYSISHYHSNELDLQRPLPNHQATPMIFPDRTGTGDLILDPEELRAHYRPYSNLNYNQFHDYYNKLTNGPQTVNFPK